MSKFVQTLVGDLLKSRAQTLINTVNCTGAMGKGIALEFKNRFPDMYEDYAQRCQRHTCTRPYTHRKSSISRPNSAPSNKV